MYIVVFWYFRYKYLVYTRYLKIWYGAKRLKPTTSGTRPLSKCTRVQLPTLSPPTTQSLDGTKGHFQIEGASANCILAKTLTQKFSKKMSSTCQSGRFKALCTIRRMTRRDGYLFHTALRNGRFRAWIYLHYNESMTALLYYSSSL